MAANFWHSTHCQHWLKNTTQEKLQQLYSKYDEFSLEEIQDINYFFAEFLQKLGNRLRFRQRVTATAIVYFKRFYLYNKYTDCNPWLVATASAFLASKIEESFLRVQDILKVVQQKFPEYGGVAEFNETMVLQCEFYMLEALGFDLIVYHPYRPLQLYLMDMNMEDECMQTAWSIVNDMYRQDLCLLYPPHLLALAAIYMACAFIRRDITDWFDKLHVDPAEVEAITKQLLVMFRDYGCSKRQEPMNAAVKRLNDLVPKTIEE